MYLNIKKYMTKKKGEMLYIYLCESKRVDGEVVNKQRYVGCAKEEDLRDGDYSFLEKLAMTRFTEKEIQSVIENIEKFLNK